MTMRLLLLEPNTVLTARVNQSSFTYPIAEVAFDGGTEFDDVLEGYTVFFGTTAGNDDLGRQRVRSGSTIGATGTLKFGRSSLGVMDGEVKLEDNAHITVFEDRRVWAKVPFIDDDDNHTIYKDHDIAYSDQNEDTSPVANAGIGFCRSLDGGTSINCDFDGTGSFATADGASISTYLWDVDDGSITVGTTGSNSITANFPVGFRYVTLTVTDSNGKTHSTYVPVFCRDPNDDDTIQSFTIVNHHRTAQGQEMSFRIMDDIPASTYPNGTLVMLWEGEPTSNSDRSHMRFIGWHQTDPAQIRAERSGTIRGTTLNCVDVAGMLKRLPGFPVEIASASSPANWGQMTTPNMDKYLHFLLHWHSTALDLTDWTDSGTGSDFAFVILGSDGESLWEQVQSKAKALVPDYILTCNRFGVLKTQIDPMLQDSGDRTVALQVTLGDTHISDISWTAQNYPRVHWLRGEAIVASATDIAAIFCIAPGTAPGQGLVEQPSGEQLAQSQADLNASEGHRYARLNAPNSLFSIVAPGTSAQITDPAVMEWLSLTIPSDVSAQRGLSLSSARGLVREVNIIYDQTRTGLVRTVEIQWEKETVGEAAVTEIPPVIEDPPDDPDGDDFPGGDDDPPPIGWGTNNIAAVNTDGFLYVTTDFQTTSAAGGPTWTRTDLSLSGTLYSFRVDPFCPKYLGTGTDVNGWIVTSSNIYYVEDMFGTPSATNQHTFGTAAPANGWRTVHASFGNFNSNQAWVGVVSYYKDSAGHTGTWFIGSTDGGTNWGSEVQITAHYSTSNAAFAPAFHLSPRSDGKAYAAAFLTTAATDSITSDGYVTTDHGANWARVSSPDIQPNHSLAFCYHVPWSGNSDEGIVYHGYQNIAAGPVTQNRTKRVNGATITDVSPSDGTRQYRPGAQLFSVTTYDPDPRYVVLSGVGNDVSTDEADTYGAAFVSDDHGATWTQIVDEVQVSGNRRPLQSAFAGDTHNVIFLWGALGYIAHTHDYGATIDDRRGNIATDFLSIESFIGIAGG